MNNIYSDLLNEVDKLVEFIIGYVTNDNYDMELNYEELRRSLISNPLTKGLLPNWVIANRNTSMLWQFMKNNIKTYKDRRTFIWQEFQPLIIFLESNQNITFNCTTNTILELGKEHDYIQNYLAKAKNRINTDPESAITNSRTLVESCLKYILDSLNIDYKDNGDLNYLYKITRKELNLAPDQHNENEFIKILSGCTSIISGLASIRNELSDSHGKRINHSKPSSRHAKLVVNLAGGMAEFLIDSYKYRYQSKSTSKHKQ